MRELFAELKGECFEIWVNVFRAECLIARVKKIVHMENILPLVFLEIECCPITHMTK